jgi:EmrB/QacA subfamily drug resistance transporter
LQENTASRDRPRTPVSSRAGALIVVASVMVLDIVDLTILNVAIPTIQRELGASDAAIQWMIAGYASVFGILIMTGGRLGDIFGYRRVLMAGLLGFTVASAVCGFAATPQLLVASRLAQGAAAALMLPQVSSVVQVLYAPHERIGVLGVFSVLGGTAAVAGPLLGGLLIEADLLGLGWRMIFLVNLPLGLLLILAAFLFMPDTRSPLAPGLDVTGTLLFTLAFASVLVPLVEGRELGWPWWCLLMLLASPVLMLATLRYSRARMERDGSALLVPGLFDDRAFATGITLATLFQATMAGTLFILTLALQNGLGFSAGQVGWAHAPYALGVAAGIGGLARSVLPRLRSRLIVIGTVVMALALGLASYQVGTGSTSLPSYFPTMLALGLGCGMIIGSLGPITLSEVDTRYAGAASGIFKSMQQFGGAVGVAVIGGVYLVVSSRPGADGPQAAFIAACATTIVVILAIALLSTRIPHDLNVFVRKEALREGTDPCK